MTKQNHDCTRQKREHLGTDSRPYHFLDSGLPNVYLVGVKYWACGECKSQWAEIPAPDKLMNVIADAIVMKPGILTGAEIRFLRKRVGKRASDFAQLINKTPEHLSKLETETLPLNEGTDKLIRLTYGMLSPDTSLLTKLSGRGEDWLNSIAAGKKPPARIKIAKARNSWSAA